MNQLPVFNRELLFNNMEGDLELVAELCEMFESHFPIVVQRIRESVEDGNHQELREAVHQLKGSIRTLHGVRAEKTASIIESIGANHGSMADASMLCNQLTDEVAELICAIKNMTAQ
jgi:HPt (histidine-containing phosphotransfer) domain-containing protein